jgi:hypothetical protein
MYRDFAKPTAYERFVANSAILMMQRGTLGGLSGVLPHRYFADDFPIMELVYRLLQSPLFGMSASEALHWVEQCFCQDHEGFHVAARNRERLLRDLRHFFADVDYLWSTNREMKVMASRGSISDALQKNRQTFASFAQAVVA